MVFTVSADWERLSSAEWKYHGAQHSWSRDMVIDRLDR